MAALVVLASRAAPVLLIVYFMLACIAAGAAAASLYLAHDRSAPRGLPPPAFFLGAGVLPASQAFVAFFLPQLFWLSPAAALLLYAWGRQTARVADAMRAEQRAKELAGVEAAIAFDPKNAAAQERRAQLLAPAPPPPPAPPWTSLGRAGVLLLLSPLALLGWTFFVTAASAWLLLLWCLAED